MPKEPVHIIVVDDEQEMLDAIAEYFEMREFRVSTATSGEEMWETLRRDPAELVLLDLALPGEDGIELTRRLRAESPIGVIIVSAHGDSADRIAGLECGADDYVVKPFVLRELMARARSVLRRAQIRSEAEGRAARRASIAVGRGRFDPTARVLLDPDGEMIETARGDIELLEVFLAAPNTPLSRDQLLERTANRQWEPLDRSIDTRVTRLRKKIEPDPSRPTVIRTVRGVGYMLQLDPGPIGD